MNESIPCKHCGLYYMHRTSCIENQLNTPSGRALIYYEVEQTYQPIIYNLNQRINQLESVLRDMVYPLQVLCSHGLAHYEDCASLNQVDEDGENASCDCGAGEKELFALQALSKHKDLLDQLNKGE